MMIKFNKILHFKKIFLPILFIGFISFTLIDKIFVITTDIKNSENKKKSSRPLLDINHLDNFPSKYEDYFNSNVSLRNYLLKHFNESVIRYLGKSPLPDKIVFGKDDWMFYGEKHLDVYRGIERFSKTELDEIKKELLYRYEYLKKRNIKYYFVILPTKYSIYPEYLKDNITRLYDNTLTDQFIESFEGKAPFKIIDTRKALIDAKKYNIRLFQKTDSHWNFAGGYFAYNCISQYLSKDFPEIKTKELSEYKIDSTWKIGGDISKMLGNEEEMKENMINLTPIVISDVKAGKKTGYDPKGFSIPIDYEVVWENPKYKKTKALIIRDSFTGYIIPFLYEDFAKSVFIFDRWEYGLNEEIIENEKPNIYMNIVLECHLKNILNNMSYNKVNQQNKN